MEKESEMLVMMSHGFKGMLPGKYFFSAFLVPLPAQQLVLPHL